MLIMKFTNMLIATTIALTSASFAFAGDGDVKTSTAQKYVKESLLWHSRYTTDRSGGCFAVKVVGHAGHAIYNIEATCYVNSTGHGTKKFYANGIRTDELFELAPPAYNDPNGWNRIEKERNKIGDLYRAKKGWSIRY